MMPIQGAVDNGNWENSLKRSSYCKADLKFLHDFGDFAKEENWILAFNNPFLLSEQKIMKMPNNIQLEIIQFKTKSIFGIQKAEVLHSLITKITANENAPNDILQTFR